MKVSGHPDCTLVVDDSLDYKPMATVKVKMMQVFLKEDPSDEGKHEFSLLIFITFMLL